MAEELFAKQYLDLELDPYQVFLLKLLRGRFHKEEELWGFINEHELDWMFENGWIRHGNNAGVSPYYWEKPNVLALVPAGFGKALALDTPLITPSGWTTMGDIRVGDLLYDRDGQPCRVIYKSPVWLDRPCYAVSADHSEPIIADADHLWLARLDWECVEHLHTTMKLASKRHRRTIITPTKPLSGSQYLPIDPYVLGAWLGDGDTNGGRMWQSVEDKPWMMSEIERCGFVVQHHKDPIAFGVLGLRKRLRNLNVLRNKHIPQFYLRSSPKDRLALLQGLVDTDGHVNLKTGVEITTIHEHLALQIQELVRSLGVKAQLYGGRATIDGKDCGPKYRIHFYMKDAARMPRKRAACRDGQCPSHYIDCTPIGRMSTACVQVDSPSHTYLAGESMIPTHNTTIVSSKVLPVMSVCDNPNARLQFIGKSDTDAGSFSRGIRRELESSKLIEDFGAFKPSDRAAPWSDRAFSVQQREWRDVRENFEFYGTNSHEEMGKRSDQVYIDDVETPDTARTPEMRAKLLEWMRLGPFTSARPLWSRDKNGRVLIPQQIKWTHTARYWGTGIVGTIFNPEALYALVMRDPTFTCVKFDCYRDKKCRVSLSDKMLTAEDLHREQRSIGTLAFNKRYRNIAYNEEEMAFREAWIRGQEEEIHGQRIQHVGCLDDTRSFGNVEDNWEVLLGFDPASGSKSRWSAYAAYVVLGYDKTDEERRIHLIDYLKLQDNFDRMLDNLLDGNEAYAIKGFHTLYDYKIGTVEKNAFGKWIVDNDRMKPYVARNIIQPHDTGTNKTDPEAGVFAMGEMFQNGRFRIPYATAADQEKAEGFIGDLLMYPKGTCDLVMALWLAQKPIRTENVKYKSWFAKGGHGRIYHNPAFPR